MVLEDFEWNVPTDSWFSLNAPPGYQDQTPTPPSVEQNTKDIIFGLKTFAKYFGGKYPQTKRIYGDVVSEELNKNAGLPLRGPPADRARAMLHGMPRGLCRHWPNQHAPA